MKNSGIILISLMVVMIFSFSCKVSDEITIAFNVMEATGYSRTIFNNDQQENGNSTLNFLMTIKNDTDQEATVIGWKFKVLHNIVTLCEITNLNYQDFKLTVPSTLALKANGITEVYLNTLQPYANNMTNNNALGFNDYLPTNVVVELQIQDADGNLYTISKRGVYSVETEIKDEETNYNILGDWELTRTVLNSKKAKQKLVFVGTKNNGEFVIYDLPSNNVFDKGSFSVSGDKQVQFTGGDGTKYWGEFSDLNNLEGTLIIKERNDTKTGTWAATK